MKNILKIIIITVLSLPAGISGLSAAQQNSAAAALRGACLSNLTLKGTLFTQSPNPLVIIEDSGTGQVIMYELGDDINGFKVAGIRRGEVTLASPEGEYKLLFPYGGVFQEDAPGLDNDDKWYHLTRQGNTITTDKETVAGAVSRARDIMRNIRIRPYSAEGKRSGIAITSLKETGILKEIGVKQGDIVKTVNGLTLNSPYQIFNAYRKLRNKDVITVNILRKGAPLDLTYRVEK